MFDMWYGDIELTTLTLIISFVVILPIQLMFCFRVKNRAVRLLPVAILSSVTAILLVIALFVQGWDGLGYAIWASFTGFMLFMCGVGWGIWWITNRKKQKVKTMKKRNFYNKLFAKYPDVVNLKQLREMLGGISEGTALKLMQKNKIKHYKVKYQYRIPKKWVIDYIMSDEYEEYCKLLRHKIER